jgi:tetratricopeptide (TPR) repeat protein
MVNVKERLFQDVKAKFESLNTDLTKMEYLESVLKTSDVNMDVKKFALGILADLYDKKLMFDKAARAMAGKAGYDITFREKIDSYLKAGEYHAKAGNILAADDAFARASREGNAEQQAKVALARKNIYFAVANDLEKRMRMANAVKFYEHLLELKLDDIEKAMIKKKLIEYYKRVGRFNDAKMVESR